MTTNDSKSLLDQAMVYLQLGYFEGAIRVCRILELRGNKPRESCAHIAWLARIYHGGTARDHALTMKSMIKKLSKLQGGQGFAELALLRYYSGNIEHLASDISNILKIADEQHGVIVTWHPTALIELAELALVNLNDRLSAIRILNCALSFRAVYVVLEDVDRLGDLLCKLNAPFSLWADWCSIFIRHIVFCSRRAQMFGHEFGDEKAVNWSYHQDAASEDVLVKILRIAPAQVKKLIIETARHSGKHELSIILSDRYSQIGNEFDTHQIEEIWIDQKVLRTRYFWYDMISEGEQHMLKNGDWAMFNTPTPDFSMALAQWWRLLESILKRSLVKNLVELFSNNPEWYDWDNKNLSKTAKDREKIFIEKLTDREKAKKLTLYDMILILKKCIHIDQAKDDEIKSGSRLRKGATDYLKKYHGQLQSLVADNWLNPLYLTQENIDLFRNRSSHDSSVDIVESAIGRSIAKQILEMFFAPVLREWGFYPILCM